MSLCGPGQQEIHFQGLCLCITGDFMNLSMQNCYVVENKNLLMLLAKGKVTWLTGLFLITKLLFCRCFCMYCYLVKCVLGDIALE
jgi:hypothetical protein